MSVEGFVQVIRRFAFGFFCVLMLGSSTCATASQIAYDGFGSGSNILGGGGTGFTGNWVDPNNEYIRMGASNLSSPQNVSLTPVGSAYAFFSGTFAALAADRLLINPISFGTDGSYYFSFLAKSGHNDYATLGLGNATTGITFGFKWGGVGTVGSFILSQGNEYLGGTTGGNSQLASSSGYGAIDGATYMFVAHLITTSSGADHLDLKAYNVSTDLVHSSPSLLSGVGNGLNQWSLSANFSSTATADRLLMAMDGNSAMDEIYVGTTWTDVTSVPEPSSWAMVAVGIAFVSGGVFHKRLLSARPT